MRTNRVNIEASDSGHARVGAHTTHVLKPMLHCRPFFRRAPHQVARCPKSGYPQSVQLEIGGVQPDTGRGLATLFGNDTLTCRAALKPYDQAVPPYTLPSVWSPFPASYVTLKRQRNQEIRSRGSAGG